MKFTVIDPKGVNVGGALLEKGKTFTSAPPHGALVRSFLHFKQVEEVKDETTEQDPPKPPTETTAQRKAREAAEKKAADEAEAKAKEEAEAKAKADADANK